MTRYSATLVADRRIEDVEFAGDPDRRPLVLLHEGLGSVGLWRGFPEALRAATGRRVLAFSRFGHGRSEPPPKPRTPAFFHEEAFDVRPVLVAEHHAGEPVLVGHSDGGSIALIQPPPSHGPGPAGPTRHGRGADRGGHPAHARELRALRPGRADGAAPGRPGCRVLLPGGHAPHAEHEDSVVAAIAAFAAVLP